jgi:aryl carrier-like protein
MSTTNNTAAPLTLESLRSDISNIIHESPANIGLDDNLMDWGLDSLRLLNLITAWNRSGLQLDISELAGQLTLNAIWQVISKRQARA